MIRLLGNRGASAVMGFFMLALASSEAPAQAVSPAVAKPAVANGLAEAAPFDVKAAVKQVMPAMGNIAYSTAIATPSGTALKGPTVTALYSTKPAPSVTVALPPSTPAAAPMVMLANGTRVAALPPSAASEAAPAIAREAAWLYRNGWPLVSLVGRYSVGAPLDAQAHCIAVAVYHEARGESLEGQLAVARVIMNRAASGRYPGSWCGVVKQPWQFSFVNPRTGDYPSIDEGSAAWQKALGITRLAINNAVPSLSNDVLWYHADYVAPSWGRRLSRVQKIGTHIFYRA